MKKTMLSNLLFATILATACNSNASNKDSKAETSAPSPTEVIKLVSLDLKPQGLAFTIKAPESAVAKKDEGGSTISVEKGRYSIDINDSYASEGQAMGQIIADSKKSDIGTGEDVLGNKMAIYKEDANGYIYTQTPKGGVPTYLFRYYITSGTKTYVITPDVLSLADGELAAKRGVVVTKEEIELMYAAIKQ
jgi:hypothetical protein